jgi:hypothetical protein
LYRFSNTPEKDACTNTEVAFFVHRTDGIWATVVHDIGPDALTNHDDFGGIFCNVLSAFEDLLVSAGQTMPESVAPLISGRSQPAGRAFDESAPQLGLVLIDHQPAACYRWEGRGMSTGVAVHGWHAVGFICPDSYRDVVSLELDDAP